MGRGRLVCVLETLGRELLLATEDEAALYWRCGAVAMRRVLDGTDLWRWSFGAARGRRSERRNNPKPHRSRAQPRREGHGVGGGVGGEGGEGSFIEK